MINQIKSKLKVLFLLGLVLFSQQVSSQTTSDSIDIFIEKKMTSLKIPAVQIAIVRNGEIVKVGNYGFANLEHQVATTSKSIFSINSITKAFVGVSIMQLQEEGKINVDDPISKYRSLLPCG